MFIPCYLVKIVFEFNYRIVSHVFQWFNVITSNFLFLVIIKKLVDSQVCCLYVCLPDLILVKTTRY